MLWCNGTFSRSQPVLSIIAFVGETGGDKTLEVAVVSLKIVDLDGTVQCALVTGSLPNK
jgi:hypothetical protein